MQEIEHSAERSGPRTCATTKGPPGVEYRRRLSTRRARVSAELGFITFAENLHQRRSAKAPPPPRFSNSALTGTRVPLNSHSPLTFPGMRSTGAAQRLPIEHDGLLKGGPMITVGGLIRCYRNSPVPALSRRLPRTSARSVRSIGTKSSSAICGSNITRVPEGARVSVASNEGRAARARSTVPLFGAPRRARAPAPVRGRHGGPWLRPDPLCRGQSCPDLAPAQAADIRRKRRNRRFQPGARSAARPRDRSISRSWPSSSALTSSTRAAPRPVLRLADAGCVPL